MVAKTGGPVEAVDELDNKFQSGLFNITSSCRKKVTKKR